MGEETGNNQTKAPAKASTNDGPIPADISAERFLKWEKNVQYYICELGLFRQNEDCILGDRIPR